MVTGSNLPSAIACILPVPAGDLNRATTQSCGGGDVNNRAACTVMESKPLDMRARPAFRIESIVVLSRQNSYNLKAKR